MRNGGEREEVERVEQRHCAIPPTSTPAQMGVQTNSAPNQGQRRNMGTAWPNLAGHITIYSATGLPCTGACVLCGLFVMCTVNGTLGEGPT